VVDFDNEDSLRKALMADDERDDNGRISKESESPDWVLDNYDPEITEVQTMSSEVLRLQVLKSYMILDADREEAFERITALASRIFDVPIALVSLVDLGRQWFLSNRGLGNVRETSRKYAFCAHAIQSRNNMLIVPDATADFRFEDNPLVTGHPNIRFYAGAPMISPEGYRLGTLCIIDTIPRPHGLNAEEQETLRDLADMTVKVMEDRKQMEKQTVDPAELIAHIAHDLLTPLTGIQLSLRMLKDDEEIINTLGELHLELLNTAVSCSDLMTRICETAVQGLRKEDGNSASSTPNEVQPCSTTSTRSSMSTTCVTKISDLIRSLHMIIDPMDKSVPCVITLADNVPPCVVGDDLKLFRSSLNLLTNALSSTLTGIVRFTIRPDDDFDQLLFECEDTGSDIPVDDYPFLFQPRRSDDGSVRLGLSSVASLIGSLGGEYGFRPRSVGPDGRVLVDATGRSLSGSIFWFSIRLLVPESSNNISQSHILPQVGNACSALVNSQPPLASDRTATANSSTLEKAATTICRGNRCEDMIAKLAGVKTISHGPSYAVNLDIAKSSVDGALASGSLNQTFAENLDFNVRKRKALVIDDSLVIRKSLSYALAKLGYDVAVAVDGMEGLKELKNVLFDLVLCDLLVSFVNYWYLHKFSIS
jgi:signal transduction histidine kinase